MGRDDDSGETPRRAPLASTISGNGSTRTKRTSGPPAVSGGLKYDPAMAASHQVYVSPNDYNTGYANDYQQRSAPYEDVSTVPPGSTSNKRKRKKDREDDWAPAPPPPPPSMVYANNTNDMSMHMAMPTILHRSNTTVPVAPPPQVSVPYETAYASQPHPNTIFNEAPVVIESFTETERRRTNAATSGSGTNSVDMSQLLHGDPMVSATSTTKTTSNGVSSWSSKGVSSGTMSVYDLFFPSPSRPKEANVSSNRNGVRESKRRRRTNGDAAERSSTRASNRRNAITPDDNLDVDMQRFTVDAFKLIPQGLVDRIDTRLRPRMITSLITSHVENWIQRTGFDDQNFLQEVTTLLNVYYPCTHAMILDEVLVAFVFKRPEVMERMMTSIIDRLQKNGESTSPTKYPVVESFARRCGMATSGRIPKRDMARHDLACLTVLRLLLERNTEKFMLSPWIASCASLCSNEVLDVMWGALLRPLISSGKTFNDNWNVRDPLDQVFELLREEKQISRFADGGACKLSMSLIKNFVQDDKYVDLRGAPVACEAFENYFGRSNNSSRLVEGWLASEQRYGLSREDALVKIMGVTIDNCSRLSVKKTNWFIKHILGFLTSLLTPRTFDVLVLQHADLFLGGVPKSELEELQSSDEAENGRHDSKIIVGKVSSNEKHAEAGVVAQVGSFLEALRGVPGDTGALVVHTWSEKWCTQGVLVPWSYVWGVLSTAISAASLETLSPVDAAFHEFACQFVKRYVTDILSRDNTLLSLPRVGRMLKTTIQNLSSKHSIALLESVLEGVARLPKSSPLAEKAHSVCAATFAEHIALSGFVGRRGAHQQAGGTSKSDVQERITLLNAVDALVSRHDPLGQLVRDQLIQRRRVGRIILEVIQDGDDVEAGAAVKIMTNVVRVAPSNHLVSLWTSSAIENVVTLGYRVRLSSTRRGAIALLNAISHNDGMCNKSLLWTVLRLCTTYCCGCNSQSRAAKLTSFNPETALEFADLVKFILKRAPKDVLADVGVFIQQQIRSCGPSKGQWNLFLVLLLDRIVQVGWSLLSATPKLAHLLLTPFELVDLSTDFEDRTVQLRALKSLCIALLAESLNQRDHNNLESWLPVARIIVSDQLTSKLKAISSRSACSTSAGLAQSITVLCEDIKESMVAKGLPQDVR